MPAAVCQELVEREVFVFWNVDRPGRISAMHMQRTGAKFFGLNPRASVFHDSAASLAAQNKFAASVPNADR